MDRHQPISRDRLRDWLGGGKDFVLLNVLPDENFRESRIKGSVNADFGAGDFIEKVEELVPDKDKPIVVYCFAGNTSPKAAEALIRAGYKNVYDYEGGIDDWEEAGCPLVEGV